MYFLGITNAFIHCLPFLEAPIHLDKLILLHRKIVPNIYNKFKKKILNRKYVISD